MHFVRISLLLMSLGLMNAQADTLITSREGTGKYDDVQASGAEKRKSRQIWLQADRVASIDSRGKMIGRLDRGETYMLQDANKSCLRIKHQQHKIDTSVNRESVFQKNGESRKVGPWETVGYEATIPLGETTTFKVTMWVSDEVTQGLDDYIAYTKGNVTPESSWTVDALLLGGYPVLQETQIGATSSWMEITSVEEKKAPAGIYEIPNGYTGCD